MNNLDVVLPVFLVLGLGAVLRRRGLLRDDARDALSGLVFYVAAPALLLYSTAATPLGEAVDPRLLLYLAALTVTVALVAYLSCARCRPSRRGVIAQGFHRANMVFMGLPVLSNAYGEEAVGQVAVTVAAMVILYNFLAVLLLTLPHRQHSAGSARIWLSTTGRVVRNPLILGCGVGILLSALHVTLPLSVERALTLVGRSAMPLALLVLGADLDFRRLRDDLSPTLLIAVGKLVVYPGLVWLGLRALGYEGMQLAAPVLILAAPTAVVSHVMAREMGGDTRLAGAIVVGTTAFSLLTFLGWLALL
jgi:predicted permease